MSTTRFSAGLYNSAAVVCPLCGQRRSKRNCPAIGAQICTVCCGTKRLVEIRCPGDCVYLTTARDHPAAAVMRRQQQDLSLVVQYMRDFNERQSQLFFLIAASLVRYQPPELHSLVDDDVIEAAEALASTYETSVRGVIYEHHPPSPTAARLAGAIKPVIAEAGKGGGTAFERDTAVVLRRIAEAARQMRAGDPSTPRGFVELLSRVVRPKEDAAAEAERPRLIVP